MSAEGPRIAAVIPLYNGERFIEDALNSVFAQTLPPDEVIVVDDGSTDNGAAIVERLAAERTVTLLRKENGGQSSARNMGIRHTDCDLIALLDQDDMWYPHHLEELVKPFLEKRFPPVGWVYSNLDEVDMKGRMIIRSTLRMLPFVQHPKIDLFGCLSTDMFVLPSSSLISRSAFFDVGGFDEDLSGFEDDDLFLRLFRAGYDNIYIDQALTKWRIFGGSASFSPRMARSRMIYLRKLIAEYPDDETANRFYTRDLLVPRFQQWMIREYTQALRRGDKAQIERALDDLVFLIRHSPNRRLRLIARLLPRATRVMVAHPGLLRLSGATRPLIRRFLR
ncbi:MAG: glycosyltransferase family 2 protein [Acetobacteraceae bacterium]